jgi:hypothetical protein
VVDRLTAGAIHEAAHAIGAHLCGRELLSAELSPDGSGLVRYGPPEHADPRRAAREDAFISLCGPVAERLLR